MWCGGDGDGCCKIYLYSYLPDNVLRSLDENMYIRPEMAMATVSRILFMCLSIRVIGIIQLLLIRTMYIQFYFMLIRKLVSLRLAKQARVNGRVPLPRAVVLCTLTNRRMEKPKKPTTIHHKHK